MPHMHCTIQYVFNLNVMETRLILKALGGRLESPEEIESAKTLGNELSRQRATTALETVKANEKLLSNIEKAQA